MYKVWLGRCLLPIPPAKIQTKIKGNNKTIKLINEGEINLIKSTGLTDISFDFTIPHTNSYFFVDAASKQQSWNYDGDNLFNKNKLLRQINESTITDYLSELERLKEKKKPFNFKVFRKNPAGKQLFNTKMAVTLEDYKINEDVKEGFDLIVSVSLKQYRGYGAKKIVKKKKKKSITVTAYVFRNTKDVPKVYKIKKGDTLKRIAKKQTGVQAAYKLIYDYNKKVIEAAAKKNGRKSSSKGKYLYAGTKIKIRAAILDEGR